MTTDPEMVRENPKIHAAVIDSLYGQLVEARSRVDKLLGELGHERFLNGQLHTERDKWKRLAWHAYSNSGMDATCSSFDCVDCQTIENLHNDNSHG